MEWLKINILWEIRNKMEGQWGFYKRRLSNYIVKSREECIRSRTDIVQRETKVRFGVLASVRVLLVKLKETIQYDNYSDIYTYIRKHQRSDTQILRHIRKYKLTEQVARNRHHGKIQG